MALLAVICVYGVLASAQEAEQPPAENDEITPGGADDVFIPTEEIPVDEEVTFPVDI
jgi:hypothetical protein